MDLGAATFLMLIYIVDQWNLLGLSSLLTANAAQLGGVINFNIGASGIVYFLAVFWLTLYLLIERRLHVPRRTINAVAFSLILLVPSVLEKHVSYLSNVVGFALSVPPGALYFYFNKRSIQSHEVL